MDELAEAVDRTAVATGFSGVVRVDRPDHPTLEQAYGNSDRRWAIAARTDHRFGIASGAKGLTALTAMRLVEDGVLELATPARDLLGSDLPLIADDVTVEHLLAHRSGIGDYLDEDAGHDIDAYVLTAPPHALAGSEDYLAVLDGHPQVFGAGERFAYNNGGYVVLALLVERAAGVAFTDLVVSHVCRRAGMDDTSFVRADELPAGAATGYLAPDGLRTNVLHLPVLGSGDGGVYTTAADVVALWDALFAGRIVSSELVDAMVRPRSDAPAQSARYGLGFWLHAVTEVVSLEGYDAGVSFRSVTDPGRRITHTVMANTSAGAWPMTRLLDELLGL